MDTPPPRKSGGIPYHQISGLRVWRMSRLTRDGTAEPISPEQIFRRERGQGNINFPCSADREQDGQPYPVELQVYSVSCVMAIRTVPCSPTERDNATVHIAGTFNMPTWYQYWVWERVVHINWSMVTCPLLELP